MFLNSLRIESIPGTKAGEDQFILLSPFAYQYGEKVYTAPVGFKTDFASVPRIFWWLFPPTGEYKEAAVIHDYLYVTQPCTRAEADKVLLEAMKDLRVGTIKRRLIYSAVRLGGGIPWKKRNRDIMQKTGL